MRRIVTSPYVTLDGVMEDPDKWSDFTDAEAARFKFDELFASDALLLGRRTYEEFTEFWPTMTDENGFADRMNTLPKYVVSTTLDHADWNNTTVVTDNVVEELARLKQQPGQDILLCGSAQLLQTLMQHDLVDEYRLMVHPIVFGSGKRLFLDGLPTKPFTLTNSITFRTGVVVLTYRPTK